jgi:hypothetical protein
MKSCKEKQHSFEGIDAGGGDEKAHRIFEGSPIEFALFSIRDTRSCIFSRETSPTPLMKAGLIAILAAIATLTNNDFDCRLARTISEQATTVKRPHTKNSKNHLYSFNFENFAYIWKTCICKFFSISLFVA